MENLPEHHEDDRYFGFRGIEDIDPIYFVKSYFSPEEYGNLKTPV